MIRYARLWVAWLLATFAAPTLASAQVRPDSVKKDTARVVAPVPPSTRVDTVPKLQIATDSAVLAREVARTDSIKRAIAGDTIKPPVAHFERPDDFETVSRLRFSRNEILSSGAVNLADPLDRPAGAVRAAG